MLVREIERHYIPFFYPICQRHTYVILTSPSISEILQVDFCCRHMEKAFKLTLLPAPRGANLPNFKKVTIKQSCFKNLAGLIYLVVYLRLKLPHAQHCFFALASAVYLVGYSCKPSTKRLFSPQLVEKSLQPFHSVLPTLFYQY